MLDLISIFDGLELPHHSNDGGTRFAARPIPEYENHRVAKDSSGTPALLIGVNNSSETPAYNPIRLEHLSILHGATCRVLRADGSVEIGIFTVIRCVDGSAELNDYFLRVMSVILVAIGATPLLADVNQILGTLIELFRALSIPPRKSLQGLWGEVFLISRTRNMRTMVDAWHPAPESLYDFALGLERIEVKTSSKRMRQHHFSLDQLCPPERTKLLIASLFVEKSGGGISVMDLANKIRVTLDNDANRLLKFERLIALTLGNGWRIAAEERFDQQLAEESLAFFEASEVPCVNREMSAKITAVHFESNLSESRPIDIRNYVAKGALFRTI